MKKILFALFIICSVVSQAQVHNNEWIDYSKTYYKFKIAKDGVYRISQATLAAAGLGNVSAENFQLWRNGIQVPVFTSVSSGALPTGGFIEFWGKMNDGKPDRELYRKPEFHISDKYSLTSDTAAYFLTINTGSNARLLTDANNVSGNTLPAEPFFMYTLDQHFKEKLNMGEAYNVDEKLYSSAYDKGEGWSSNDINTTYSASTGFTYGKRTIVHNNLFKYNGGPETKVKIGVAGNSFNPRTYKVALNNDTVISALLPYMDYSVDSASFSSTLLGNGPVNISVINMPECATPPYCPVSDNMVIIKYELTYPRQFNFGGASNFEFTLPASATGNYLEISGFNFGAIAPVLYDLSNGKRYVADISAAPLVKIVLPASATSRNLILVSQESGNIATVPSMERRDFVNYGLAGNQGNYLIISHPLLFNGAGGSNPVEEYRAYRSSVVGGSYNAKIYLADEIIDQFGFGIKKNPAGIRNFIRFANRTYNQKPKYVFLVGKGVTYRDQRAIEIANNPVDLANTEKLNLVPTFGWPSSDVLLSAEPGTSVQEVPLGRLSAITPEEVSVYLKKIKDFELAQRTMSPVLKDRNWMKNIVHMVGTNEPGLDGILTGYMEKYRQIIEDTLYGGHVSTFRKLTTSTADQLNSSDLVRLFNEGISFITYFGHSSSTTLDFNLDDPQNYSNFGKYPLFIALGCNVGNFYTSNPVRFSQKETISEKYVLSPDRGTIAFIASTHFGIVHYLDVWAERAYKAIGQKNYGKSIGEIMKKTIDDVYAYNTQDDFFARANSEQTTLHGDPAITLNPHPKPDYIIEDQLLKITPNFISIADTAFKLQASFYNNGWATNKKIVVQVARQFPDGSTKTIRRDTIQGIHYVDSLTFDISIDPVKDKGSNKLTISIDADNSVDEIFENNNSVTREIIIYEDEARPVYPLNFAIVNRQNIKLIASTANVMVANRLYRMELDTSELFNSPVKVSRDVNQVGGIIEFDPAITFSNNTVYFWRVAMVQPNGSILNWNYSSFLYASGSAPGFNQSHYFQHLKSVRNKINIDPSSKWTFGTSVGNLTIKSGVFPTAASLAPDFGIFVNGDDYIRSVCGVNNIIVNVFDPNSFLPWYNADAGQPGQFGSDVVCGANRAWNFQFSLTDSLKRKSLVEFLENIPSGHYVVVRNVLHGSADTINNNRFYAAAWKKDTSYLGSNRSIYHHLFNQGFTTADELNRTRAFIFTYKKDDKVTFAPKHVFSEGIFDKITLPADYPVPDTLGLITSPMFGPAKSWIELRWQGTSIDPTMTDKPRISIRGIKADGSVEVLRDNIGASQEVVDISNINASVYPYLQLHMVNEDNVNKTPYQLKYWRLTYVPVPEGALAPNLNFRMKDTLDVAEPLDFQVAFKNISEGSFDSLKVKMVITDRNNVKHVIAPFKVKKLPSMDTVNVRYIFDTRQLVGANELYVEVNPDYDQPEQYHFNNFAYTRFYVRGDTLNPVMDVTFDNVHILNHDIVSSKPEIVIKLQDEAKWHLLTDPSVANVQVRFPDGNIRTYAFASDTLRFNPPAGAPTNDNTATINFKPYFPQDGEYELIVSGKDMSNNQAGRLQYRVFFNVINKAMISNLLNYPNPFTTSTAFVFTLTGNEVPQNIKIQILTVTGRVVREITKDELGPLHIGRNITEFKWDGTDQYGQKLANGVYLYRVITNLNGQTLEKYRSDSDNTDKYFNKGYGKMYLMR